MSLHAVRVCLVLKESGKLTSTVAISHSFPLVVNEISCCFPLVSAFHVFIVLDFRNFNSYPVLRDYCLVCVAGWLAQTALVWACGAEDCLSGALDC